MSRYPPADFRGSRDRSRSPPRFADRRPSAASIFDGRPQAGPRTTSDLPRGPRPSFDGQRPPPNASPGPSGGSRPSYTSLRDAPPLGSGDRSRSYREREYRAPSPRDRSPPSRGFKDSRDFPPRDIDHSRDGRDPRDGPLSAGSRFSEGQNFPGPAPPRGGFIRGRARADSVVRGGRGGRPPADDRDLFSRRERSPPLRWGRDLSRDSRDSDRRDDRRFERRDDERRPLDWPDRDRDAERVRRDPAPQRLESRPSNESLGNAGAAYQPSQSLQINPQRLALIESSGAGATVRRPSIQSDAAGPREARKDQSDTPAYLTGRAETTANRYGSRGSSPPTQAPPSVPAFGFSFAPPAAQSASASQPPAPAQEFKSANVTSSDVPQSRPNASNDASPSLPAGAPTGPKVPPVAPKAHIVSPPPASAPKAPRALETEEANTSANRMQGMRPQENPVSQTLAQTTPTAPRSDNVTAASAAPSVAPTGPPMHSLLQPAQPSASQLSKPTMDIQPPTGPRASRVSPALPSASPRAPFTSPRFDAATIAPAAPRPKTPPPAAPSGPRHSAFSTSPQAPSSTVPTQPKANRLPPFGGRPVERAPLQSSRAPERPGAPQPWVPPSGPRNQPQWHQWRRPNAPIYPDKMVPAKRDMFGEEKSRISTQTASLAPTHSLNKPADNALTSPTVGASPQEPRRPAEVAAIAQQPPRRQTSIMAGHSGKQSWLGKLTKEEEASSTSDNAHERSSSSDDDDSDPENHLALLHAKFQKQRRILEARMVDLSARSYRATTPCENLARLARISTRDLERLNEQAEHAMDVDKSPITRRPHTLPESRRSSDSVDGPNVHTPNDEEDDRVRIRSSDDSSDGVRRVRRPTPEPVSLPYLLKDGQSSMEDRVTFADALKEMGGLQDEAVASYDHWMQDEEEDQEHWEQAFDAEYRSWREDCEQLDKIKEEQEKLERQQSLEPKLEVDAPSATTGNAGFEGRRLYKFSSEYEMELVLKQSEETARIEQERQEREARKNQADMEKEATICDQATPDEAAYGLFINNNRYREPYELSAIFTYLPPPDDFTPNEQHVFLGAYKENPKKWGEIASLLPGRSYQDCIRHYYANKWDNRYRDRIKKRGPGRRGRGGPRGPRGRLGGLMADLRPHEDVSTENMSEKGRPRRAAAPTTFAEKEAEAKATLMGTMASKKLGGSSKNDSNGEGAPEKPGKRQKRTGEKPGRKSNKASQPILAAAPDGSPRKQFMLGGHSKEDLADANLLASLANRNGLNETQMMYHQDGQMHHVMPHFEELERSKAAGQAPAAKQGPSSYWSVPEQNDFVKYISHFGTDFHAIAQHMVTKSMTMIKNHYQRQVDGGNRPDLEQAARAANERRARGEDIGPPPAPTPIQKRKYENPPVPAQRAIAPQAENVEMEDAGPQQRVSTIKHASPQQYPPQPRFANTMQQKPTSTAARIVPSPLSSAATPMSVMSTAYQPKTMQNPLGTKMSFMTETRPEVVPNYRPAQESPVRNYLSQQARRIPDPQHPEYVRNLAQEQERALRVQERNGLSERPEQFHLHPAIPRNPSHGSPLSQPIQQAPERKQIIEERAASPARPLFPASGAGRPLFGSTSFLSGNPLASIAARSTLNMSPTKREEPRPGSLSAVPPVSHPVAATPPPPSEPKRSNLLSLLNADSEPSRPVKPDPMPIGPPKAASPVQRTFSAASAASEGGAGRRELSFGQPSVPQSHFRRESFSAQNPTASSMPPSLKHESSVGNNATSQGRKPDWATQVLSQASMQPSPPTPTIDRDGRSLFSHRSMLGLGPRANPSPPPLGSNPHSRTPSLSNPSGHQPREQLRAGLPGQHSASQPGLQPNLYASQQASPLSQQQTSQAQNHAHHSHNTSISSGPFPTFHQRNISREEYGRQDSTLAARREREEQESRWRREPLVESDLQRRAENPYRQQDATERDRQQPPPQQPPLHRTTLQPPPYSSSSSYQPGRMSDIRSQALNDVAAEFARRDEQERLQRMQQDQDRRRQEQLDIEAARRRHPEEASYRRTPLGGSFGVLPPPPPPSSAPPRR